MKLSVGDAHTCGHIWRNAFTFRPRYDSGNDYHDSKLSRQEMILNLLHFFENFEK